MSSIAERLSTLLGAAFESVELDAGYGRVARSNRPDLAPYQCNGAMAAAKAAKRNPREIAEAVAQIVRADPMLADVEVAGAGFLNLTPALSAYTERANELAADPRSGAQTVETPRRVMIDFGGPNVAKPMHVGHIRSSVIGDALQRLFRFRGDTVTSDIHLGDWGLQMGHLITELEGEQPDLPYFDAANDGPFPDEPPVDIEDLARLYPVAAAKAKADPERLTQSRRATAELQGGRAGYRALLRHFIDVSVAALKIDFDGLGVKFDLWKGESDVHPLVSEIIADFKARGVTEQSDGAWIVRVAKDTDKKELLIVVKADVQGSVEVIKKSVEDISTEEVTVRSLFAAVGGITESDVTLAAASGAVIVGFNVIPSSKARQLAEAKHVEIRSYRVIYDIVDDMYNAAEGLLEPEVREDIIGHAEVRGVFRVSKIGAVAGCYVTDGAIERNALIRVKIGRAHV